MRQVGRGRTFLVLTVIAVGLALQACGRQAAGGWGCSKGGKDIVLTKFRLIDRDDKPLGGTGSTDVSRNARLLFVFSAPVRFSSVNSRTIRVGIKTGDGLFRQAPGRFERVRDHPNEVRFHPEFSESSRAEIADNPFGLAGNALYLVEIPAPDGQETCVQNRDGDRIFSSFAACFVTGEN